MGRTSVLLCLSILFFSSCIDRRDVNEEAFDIYEYYLEKPEFAYQLTGEVKIVDSLPPLELIVGTQWTYLYREEDYLDTISRLIIVELLSLQNGIAQFSVDGNPLSVQIDGPSYSGVLTSTQLGIVLDSSRVVKELPIPHWSYLTTPYNNLCIRMDDGSTAFSREKTVFSSRFGRIEKFPSCLVSYNGGNMEEIAQTVHEYLVKEQAWFQ